MKRALTSALLIAVMLTLTLGAAPARAQDCGDETYVVRLGDTLYSIAEECGITNFVVLMNINYEISDPARIYPGQIIRLVPEADINTPGAKGLPQVGGLEPEGGVYIVRPGDSLARIAYLYSTTVAELVRANPELNWRTEIYPGQRITLPKDAKRTKGWVGLSALTGSYPDEIKIRVVDFPPYALVDLNLGLRGLDAVYETVQVKTDARGEGHGTIRIPYYADAGEIWEIHATAYDKTVKVSAVSAGITITD